jgi:hypothetical protein
LPRPADQPESNNTLPDPELNPLVNPLLGQNMGRWAEVYFTSPPEKREQAVLNLLRELEGDAPGASSNTGTSNAVTGKAGTQPSETLRAREALQERPPQSFTAAEEVQATGQDFILCRSCSAQNSADQKFCGQCGALLPGEADETATRNWPSQAPSRNEVAEFSTDGTADRESSLEETRYAAHHQDTQTSVEADTEHQTTSAYDDPRDYPWRSDVDAPQFMPVYEPVPYRYRIYVGTAVALLITALIYIAWHGTQATSEYSHTLPQAAPSAATKPPERSQTPPVPVAPSSAKAGTENDKAKVPAPGDSKTAGRKANQATTRMDDATGMKKASTPASLSTRVVDQPASLPDNGSRELAVAEGFLQGAQGKVRDSGEAAKWLWQAVRKENAAATLILSELYLKGDGVPKSCDQGRLLLNAAGRRGAPGAGERIRNLQAFGCQ